jgi:hypothetical protein
MTDRESWRQPLEPPPGGLARLQRSVGARGVRKTPGWRAAAVACSSAAVAALLATGLAGYRERAPQRDFERSLQAAMATLNAPVVERGIARDLPSSRADVRIVELAPAAATPPQP